MSAEALYKLCSEARQKWITTEGLLLSAAAGVAVIFAITVFPVFPRDFNLVLFLIGIYFVILPILWGKSQIRIKRGKVGVGVAVFVEDQPSSQELYSDFVSALTSLFEKQGLQNSIEFVEFPQIISKSLRDSSQAFELARRSNVTFLLFGQTRLRDVSGDIKNIIDFKCLVRHVPIDNERGSVFANELNFALPGRWFFKSEKNFLEAEISAQYIEIVTRYIIGITCGFAGNFEGAEGFLVDARNRLLLNIQKMNGDLPQLLKKRIEDHIKALYRYSIEHQLSEWQKTQDVSTLNAIEEKVHLLRSLEPEDYMAQNVAAICSFVLRGDVGAAYEHLEKSKNENDPVWLYNSAFLKAYEGDLDEAYQLYKKAFQMPLSDSSIPIQCETFINSVLEKEPHRTWLYFCLGLINYRAKKDYLAAANDFRNFLLKCTLPQYAVQYSVVNKWLKEMEQIFSAAN